MKTFRTIKDFITEIHFKEGVNIIYGAGWGGRIVGAFMKNRDIPLSAFSVTKQECDWMLEGTPVYCIDQILNQYQPSNINVILSIGERYRDQMRQELKARGIDSYYEVPEILQYDMLREIMRSKAEKVRFSEKKNSQMTIGYLTSEFLAVDYSQKRLIMDKIDSVSYVAMPWELPENRCQIQSNVKQILEACYSSDQHRSEVDFIHTFNTVCDTDSPWCASFETKIPRVWPVTENEKEYYLQLVEYIKRPNCRALYALSQNAYNIQKQDLMSYISPDEVDVLMKKTKVLHAPQEVLISEEEFINKHNTQKIHFIFVGRLFFIKGGRECIQALSRFEERYRFKLTLISSLQYNDHFTKTSIKEMERCRDMIREKSWIDYYESLPNEEVLKKCKEAAIGLLPSVAETYGYVILEMQAAGCPVVTTNIRAMPELNNEECGWVCRIPVDELGNCAEPDSAIWSEILERELERCFQEIFNNPDKIKEKGRKALERIKRMHDPYEYQNELKKNFLEME